MSPKKKPLPPLLPVNLSRQYNINRDPTLAMKAAVFSPLVYVCIIARIPFCPKRIYCLSVHKVADRWVEEGKKFRTDTE